MCTTNFGRCFLCDNVRFFFWPFLKNFHFKSREREKVRTNCQTCHQHLFFKIHFYLKCYFTNGRRSRPLFVYFVFSTNISKYVQCNFLPMTGFEPQITVIESAALPTELPQPLKFYLKSGIFSALETNSEIHFLYN